MIVNLFGGPGSGKTTLTAGIFSILKWQGVKCDVAWEWIKQKVFKGHMNYDQIYVFGKQHAAIHSLYDKVDVVLTDSPLMLSPIYDREQCPLLEALCLKEHRKLDQLNYFVKRVKPYSTVGRYQDEDEARKLDAEILNRLDKWGIKYYPVDGVPDTAKVIVTDILAVMCGERPLSYKRGKK